MSVQKELQEIRNGQIAPVYLLFGEEEYLINQVKAEIETVAFPQGTDEMSKTVYDLNNNSLSQVLMEAQEIPFFSEKRLIIAENPSFLTTKKATNSSVHNIDELLEYLKAPSEDTILLFLVQGAVDGRSKAVKALKKSAEIIEATPLAANETKVYVSQYLKNEGITFSPESLEALMERTNYALSPSMNEAQKLILLSSKDKKFTAQDVRNLVAKSLEQNIFDLSEYVLAGNAGKAISLLDDLLLQGENIIALNGILLSKIRLILQTQLLMKESFQQGQIAQSLGVNPYPVKLAMQQARKFDMQLLSYIFDQLVEMDYKMKTSQMENKLLFELTILDITEKIRGRNT